MAYRAYYKIVKPTPDTTQVTDNQAMSSDTSYGNYSWYHRVVAGSSSRLTRYREFEVMDNDIEINRALDTVAEEMAKIDSKTMAPLEILMMSDDDDLEVAQQAGMTLNTALRRWSDIHDFDNRLFKICRQSLKYGDCFFHRNGPFKKWAFINPKNVTAAIVSDDDVTDIKGWKIATGSKEARTSYGSPLTGNNGQEQSAIVPSSDIVRFSLYDDMSDQAPFGDSILNQIYRTHKQKELLEDAILIYRLQRAPEKRVFYVDVGGMSPHRVKQYLEQIKVEIRQKKIPNSNGGRNEVESVYNPASTSEDFYFARRSDGRGSSVEVLPGGSNLGELQDLQYFYQKMTRGLRIPLSYAHYDINGENNTPYNDGKSGLAYIQEVKFIQYVMRLQRNIEKVLDQEFKRFLRESNINIDETIYKVKLPDPTNFDIYRQQAVDTELLSSFMQADQIPYASKRFILKRYLRWTDAEIGLNEILRREEMDLQKEPNVNDLPNLYVTAGMDEFGNAPSGGMSPMEGGMPGETPEESTPEEDMTKEPVEPGSTKTPGNSPEESEEVNVIMRRMLDAVKAKKP